MRGESRRGVREVLDAAALRAWLAAATGLVQEHCDELDALNVYPVADHDTGRNVLATLRVVLDDSAAAASAAAKGNSGLIIAEWLRGVLHEAGGRMTATTLRAGLRRGEQRAYAAVSRPVQGTVLSVAGAAAAATPRDGSLESAAATAAMAANDELMLTRDRVPELRRAGVVDAGARALCLMLDALLSAVTGRPAAPLPVPTPPPPAAPAPGRARYEVTYTIQTAEIGRLREELDRLGDSVVTAGVGPGEWAVHVHVADAGAAVEAAVAVGRPRTIRIEPLPAAGSRLLAALGLDPAIGSLLAAEGVQLLEAGPVGADVASVVLLAAGGSAGEAQEAVDRLRQQGCEAAVVPLRAPVQALAAVAVHDPAVDFSDAVVAMAEAAAATRFGEVCTSGRAALTSVGPCRAGDTLGLAGDDVVLIGREPRAVAGELLDRMLATSGELVTLVGGELVSPMVHHLATAHPSVEVQSHPGAGPGLLIGVE